MYDLGARDRTATDLTIAYVGGGSRDWAQTLINDLALCSDLGGEVRLYDHDRESARQNARLGNSVQSRPEAVGNWQYVVADELVDALSGADFVLLSTQDPPAETMVHDLDVPREYGIYQSVGDTVGPGGTLRAMRAIPQYLRIGRAIRDHCPDAWVLNFTNPMSVCTRTLYEAYPDIDAVGVCHEVYGAQAWLADLVSDRLDVDADGEQIDVDVAGINHFTWATGARWRGRDILPLVDDRLAEREPLTDQFAPGDLDDASYFVDNHLITLDLYRRFGALPVAGDRHLAEFVPWYLAVDSPAEVHRWGIRLTPSEYRVAHWPDGEATREAYLDGDATFEFSDSGEEIVDILRALCGHRPLRTNLNLPNRGQVGGVDEGAVVETNALVTADSVTPLDGGRLPADVRSRVRTHVQNQESLVAAGVDGDVERAYSAFLNDPLVSLSADRARDLFCDMVGRQRAYLEDWDLDSLSL